MQELRTSSAKPCGLDRPVRRHSGHRRTVPLPSVLLDAVLRRVCAERESSRRHHDRCDDDCQALSERLSGFATVCRIMC
jgi:hypothetical protein